MAPFGVDVVGALAFTTFEAEVDPVLFLPAAAAAAAAAIAAGGVGVGADACADDAPEFLEGFFEKKAGKVR